ncbi:MAG TPA: signal recognition particle receptor subunit alpha [Candidatus Norongarragalinales archaeon]|jgi:signal recognition particle subunit SRP54|nr:signal recognition particle receptor subunit alpha [Candidatus Norongarragalinales archaeon]
MDLGSGIRKALAKLTGATLVDDKAIKELVKELQRVLISNDVNVKLVLELSKRIGKRAIEEKPPAGFSLKEHVTRVVYDELAKLLGEKFEPRNDPHRILMVGLFGQGKTTTIGKLAKFYMKRGHKVGVIAADVHRPAAFDQLKQVAEGVKCGFFGIKGDKDAPKLAREGLAALKDYDIIILDSAGRSGFDEELVNELKKMNEIFKPDEKYLVVGADQGQVAGRQAEQFNNAIGITGVIVTRMDGSGKGGGALSSVAVSGTRVAFIGTGEKMDALELFDSKKFVARLLGFPDLETLLEKAKEATEEEKLQEAMEEGKLNYETFLAQMKAMKKMGPLKSVFQMMGAYDVPEEVMGQSESRLKKFEAAVHSMTPAERRAPDLMKEKKRQERVAKGSGLSLSDVKELVSSFEKMQKMMKGMRGNRGLLKQLGKKFSGGLPGLR